MTKKTNRELFILMPGSANSVIERREQPNAPTLEELYAILGTDTVEHVNILLNGQPSHMWVDENGRLREETKRDLNARATALYHNATIAREDKVHVNGLDVLLRDDHDFELFFHAQVPPIVGKAVVWPYPAPKWEPEGRNIRFLNLAGVRQ